MDLGHYCAFLQWFVEPVESGFKASQVIGKAKIHKLKLKLSDWNCIFKIRI